MINVEALTTLANRVINNSGQFDMNDTRKDLRAFAFAQLGVSSDAEAAQALGVSESSYFALMYDYTTAPRTRPLSPFEITARVAARALLELASTGKVAYRRRPRHSTHGWTSEKGLV